MIQVCYTCNEDYAPIVGTSIISIMQNLSSGGVHFWILCDTFSLKTKEKFNKIANKYLCKIDCIDISNKMSVLLSTALADEPGMVRKGQISYMYARLFMGSAISKDVDKVIYIDADTIIQCDLTELYTTELKKNKILAAIRDVWPVNYNKVIGFDEYEVYFQSGLMLVNLYLWRQEKVELRIMEYIKNLKIYPALHDQDIINICIKGKIQTLPVKYGMIYLLRHYSPNDIYYFSGKSIKQYYSSNEILSAKKTLNVIHYSGDYFGHPWVRPYACSDAKIWQKYFAMSPWREYNPFYKKPDIKYLVKKILYPFISKFWLNRFRTRCWQSNEHLYHQINE